MRRITIYSMVLALALSVGSCYPGGIEYYEDTDIVFTSYEPDYDFTTANTYSMPDSVVKVTGDAEADPEFIDEPYNTQIINRIAAVGAVLGLSDVGHPDEHQGQTSQKSE